MSRILMLFALLASFALTACGSDDDDNKGKGGAVAGQTADLTDYSLCRGETPAGLEITSNSWTTSQIENGIRFDSIVNFSQNEITVAATCFFEGMETTVTARAPVNINQTTVEILGEDSANDKIVTTKGDLSCRVDIEKATASFAFQGPCLVLTMGGETSTLPPAQAAFLGNDGF